MNVEEPTSHKPRKDTMVQPNVSTKRVIKKKKKTNCPISLPGHEQKDTQSLGHTMMVPGITGVLKRQLGSKVGS